MIYVLRFSKFMYQPKLRCTLWNDEDAFHSRINGTVLQ